MEKYAYVRVSSIKQNEQRQIENMTQLGIKHKNIFVDKMTGKYINRPQYQKLKTIVQSGDTIIFDSITRMSRNYDDIKHEYEDFRNNHINVQFIKEPFLNINSTNTNVTMQKMMVDLLITVASGFAQIEREEILERQREGIAIAKREGKYKGREKKYTLTHPKIKRALEDYDNKTMPVKDICTVYDISKATLYRALKERTKHE